VVCAVVFRIRVTVYDILYLSVIPRASVIITFPEIECHCTPQLLSDVKNVEEIQYVHWAVGGLPRACAVRAQAL
jgi:hypothetical protein